jgi:hypothetical protein
VHPGAEVREGGGRGIGKAIEDLDQAALFSHEDPPILRKLDGGGFAQAAENDRVLKS